MAAVIVIGKAFDVFESVHTMPEIVMVIDGKLPFLCNRAKRLPFKYAGTVIGEIIKEFAAADKKSAAC